MHVRHVGRARPGDWRRDTRGAGTSSRGDRGPPLRARGGPRQPEVQRLYERAGYVVCDPWGQFVGKELSVCMQKVASPG